MAEQHIVKLTAGEVGHLWEQYLNNNLASVTLNYLVEKIDNDEIRNVCSFALMTVETDLNRLSDLYQQERYTMPKGFGPDDRNPNAPKPVTDEFVLSYLQNMAQVDLALTSVSLADAVRVDVRQLFQDRLRKAMELHDKATSLLLEKGMFVRSPLITSTEEAHLADDGFMANWFGIKPRTLTACEAHELHKNVMLNYQGKCLMMVFLQTNTNENLQRLLLRGKELASKIMKELSEVLIENDLPVAMTWDTHVLDTKESPFSDRFICNLVDQLNKFGIASYGYSATVSTRKDLKAMYARIIADVYQYEADMKTFMIKNDWLERPPIALDRRSLSEV